MQIPSFVSLCKYRFWSHERTHSIRRLQFEVDGRNFFVIWYVCETMLSSFTRGDFPWRFSFLKELEGALWRLLSHFGMLKWCLQINGNSKLMIKFVYCGRNNCTETVYRSLLLRMGRIEVVSILKNLASIFQSFRTHLKEKTKNVPWITVAKKLIDVLVLDFKAMFRLE